MTQVLWIISFKKLLSCRIENFARRRGNTRHQRATVQTVCWKCMCIYSSHPHQRRVYVLLLLLSLALFLFELPLESIESIEHFLHLWRQIWMSQKVQLCELVPAELVPHFVVCPEDAQIVQHRSEHQVDGKIGVNRLQLIDQQRCLLFSMYVSDNVTELCVWWWRW